MMEMPNAGEIIERLARENERQKIEIEQLKQRIAELERTLTEKASQTKIPRRPSPTSKRRRNPNRGGKFLFLPLGLDSTTHNAKAQR